MPLFPSSRAFVTLDFRHLDCAGLELWNAMSAFKQDLDRPISGLAQLIMPRTFLAGSHPLLLALWDSQGRAYLALGRARGFDCRLHPSQGPEELPGSQRPWQPGLSLVAKLPGWGRARLVHNGRVVAQRWRPLTGWRPWIYCNPFYLRQAA